MLSSLKHMLAVPTCFLPVFAAAVLPISCGRMTWKNPPAAGLYDPRFTIIRDKILIPRCLSCHIGFEAHKEVMQYVEPLLPDKSRLFDTINHGQMPQNGVKLADFEINTISTWIRNGALND